ncbi:MAG: hypothetical protein H7235_01175 [Bdellovibrionaceae bacterium]|nr:hypothetical protein [Pseudobdellovibrionaceae bacterium]
MFNKIISIIVLSLAVSLSVSAHEGHDNAPGVLKANHGGVVKAGKEINLEYIVSGNEVKLFPISHEGKDLADNDVKLVVSAKQPKGKAEVVKLETKNGVIITKVDFKNAYRVEMKVDAEFNGKKSTFIFQVEK